MKTISNSFQWIAFLGLSVFLACSSLHLNAEIGDDEETEDEDECVIITVPPKPSVLIPEGHERIGSEYNLKIKNWAERIKPINNPRAELDRVFDLPDLKERIFHKIGYFPFVWTYFSIEVSKTFPNLIQEMVNEANTSNNPIAQFNIGWMSSFDQGDIKQDINKALKYYQQAAENNVRLAQYICGVIYHENQKSIEALNYIQKAAENGLAIAQYALGLRLINNNQENGGEIWLRKAAVAGLPAAQYALSTYLSYTNRPIEKNDWLGMASTHGFTPKYDPIEKLKDELLLQKWLDVSMNDGIPGDAQHLHEL